MRLFSSPENFILQLKKSRFNAAGGGGGSQLETFVVSPDNLIDELNPVHSS